MKHLPTLAHRLLRAIAEDKPHGIRHPHHARQAHDKLVRVGFINEDGVVTSAGHNYLRRYDKKDDPHPTRFVFRMDGQ